MTYTWDDLTWVLQNSGYDIGDVVDAYVSETTDLGNVYSVTFVDSRGRTLVRTGDSARMAFYSTTLGKNVPSLRFTISGGTGGGGSSVAVNSASNTLDSLDGVSVISGSGGLSRLDGERHTVLTADGRETVSGASSGGGRGSRDGITVTGKTLAENLAGAVNKNPEAIRPLDNPYSATGGLAVLFGNVARKGCIVKTAGVDPSILHFEGKACVFESQEEACVGILGGKVQAGDVVVIRYEGPKGGPGMQEMLYPTSYLKSVKLDKACALVTDGRFSGGTSGLSIGHVSPEAAAGGAIALLEDGDPIVIDIASRAINVQLSQEELDRRRAALGAFKPRHRDRVVSRALKAYAAMVASADKGGVRIVE